MAFDLSRGIANAAAGVADIAGTYAKSEIVKKQTIELEKVRAQIQMERDARQNEFTRGENEANRGLTREEGAAGRGLTREEGAATRSHSAGLQRTSLEHAAEQGRLSREHSSEEGDKNRGVQRATIYTPAVTIVAA